MKHILIFWLAITSIGVCQSVQTKSSGNPSPIHSVLFYDDEFCFVGRGYVSSEDSSREIEPGIFVHSKRHNRWLRLTKITTEGGIFGTSCSNNPEDQKKLVMASIGWNFTGLKNAAYAELPLRYNRALAFPKISFDSTSGIFQFGFMADWDIPSARTYLFFKRKDLLEAFDKQ